MTKSSHTRQSRLSSYAFTLFYIWCCYLLCLITLPSTLAQLEIDVSWEFSHANDRYRAGWGNASAEQIDMEVKVDGGELRCSITGLHPVLDSPRLYLNVTNRHYVVMRMRYSGHSTQARLLLRSGSMESPDYQLLANHQYWQDRQPMIAINSSTPWSSYTDMHQVVDSNPYTYYQSMSNKLAWIIFDLKDSRQITGIRVLPYGDWTSPKRLILFKSLTSGVGPFEKVLSFTIENTWNHTAFNTKHDNAELLDTIIKEQVFTGFSGYARYWKLLVVDNYGAPSNTANGGIRIRDVVLDGYDERVTIVPFDIDNSGAYHTYHLPIHTYLTGTLQRMRIELLYPEHSMSSETATMARGQVFRESLAFDFIRIMRAPLIWKTRGCLDKYFSTPNYQVPMYNVTSRMEMINDHLPIYYFIKNNMSYQYATTYDCPLEGNRLISIEGVNFGDHPLVTIDNRPCAIKSVSYSSVEGRVQQILCVLPSGLSSGTKQVRVTNSLHPKGLFFEYPGLAYRTAPPVLSRPTVTNIGATRVDLIWQAPSETIEDELASLTITGYKILWFQPTFPSFISNVTVGNITTTSIRGLEPGTEYVFAIAAMAEGQENANLPTDLYGRRDPVPGAMIGTFSTFTNVTGTLDYDFNFAFFNSNQTLNSSTDPFFVNTNGPTGQYGSEGHYGLVMVGSANIQNCNVSSTCCDNYNASIGIASCSNSYRSVCSVLSAYSLAYEYVIGGVTRRGVPSNLPYSNGRPPDITISTLDELIANKGADLPSSACGPALRLTPAQARSSGSVWYRRKMNVREGFDTYIKFQISNPSQKCDRLDDVNTFCRSRGADGFAFVIQNVAPDALGNAGAGLGYEGIDNALAIELDTYHNYDNMDFYENHISVMTQGYRYNITANHSRSLATTNRVPDLTDGIHTVRIKYDPNFDANAVPHQSFQVTGHTTWFLNNADYKNGGEPDWGTGFGLLYVYLDDMYSPVITTPINLAATLELDDGRSYVGITASTGDQYWQAHDILGWRFTSLFIDEEYHPPLRVNGEGAHQCVNQEECVHPVDYDHYMRKNNLWGKGSDNTEGWMTGKDGFCALC